MPNLSGLTAGIAAATSQQSQAFEALAQRASAYSNTAISALEAITKAQNEGLKSTQASGPATQKAEQQKLIAVLSALKSKAAMKAVEATAQGLGDLASLNFEGAALEFASAAMWGTITGASIASATGGGSSSAAAARQRANNNAYSGRGGSGSSEEETAPEASGLAQGAQSARQPPTGNLTIAIMGDNEAGNWLAKTLNTAVQQHGAQLQASSVSRSPYAAG